MGGNIGPQAPKRIVVERPDYDYQGPIYSKDDPVYTFGEVGCLACSLVLGLKVEAGVYTDSKLNLLPIPQGHLC